MNCHHLLIFAIMSLLEVHAGAARERFASGAGPALLSAFQNVSFAPMRLAAEDVWPFTALLVIAFRLQGGKYAPAPEEVGASELSGEAVDSPIETFPAPPPVREPAPECTDLFNALSDMVRAGLLEILSDFWLHGEEGAGFLGETSIPTMVEKLRRAWDVRSSDEAGQEAVARALNGSIIFAAKPEALNPITFALDKLKVPAPDKTLF